MIESVIRKLLGRLIDRVLSNHSHVGGCVDLVTPTSVGISHIHRIDNLLLSVCVACH